MIDSSQDINQQGILTGSTAIGAALSLLEEALHQWHDAEKAGAQAEDFPAVYESLYTRASDYRDFLVQHDTEFSPPVLRDLLIASAELDGLNAAYYHGHELSDLHWDREARQRHRQIESVRKRLMKAAAEGEERVRTPKRGTQNFLAKASK